MVTIPIFSVVVIIFILHTVLTHLINWWFREADEEIFITAIVFYTIAELTLIIALLDYYIS